MIKQFVCVLFVVSLVGCKTKKRAISNRVKTAKAEAPKAGTYKPNEGIEAAKFNNCLLYTSPSPRDS